MNEIITCYGGNFPLALSAGRSGWDRPKAEGRHSTITIRKWSIGGQRVQYLILRFQHGLEDIIPWCEFIEKMRRHLARIGAGEFEGDDMAIDGGDCEAVFRGPDVKKLFAVLLPHFRTLPLLVKPTTKAELIFGEIDSSAQRHVAILEC